MLKAEKQCQENGYAVVKAVERRLIVFVLSVQGPDIGGNQVDVVLGAVSYL